jgi:hypothetical protein
MVNTDNGMLEGNGVEYGSVPDIFKEMLCGFFRHSIRISAHYTVPLLAKIMEEEIIFRFPDKEYRPFLHGSKYNNERLNNTKVRSVVPRSKPLAKSCISFNLWPL